VKEYEEKNGINERCGSSSHLISRGMYQ
jgi:hypothetical protein